MQCPYTVIIQHNSDTGRKEDRGSRWASRHLNTHSSSLEHCLVEQAAGWWLHNTSGTNQWSPRTASSETTPSHTPWGASVKKQPQPFKADCTTDSTTCAWAADKQTTHTRDADKQTTQGGMLRNRRGLQTNLNVSTQSVHRHGKISGRQKCTTLHCTVDPDRPMRNTQICHRQTHYSFIASRIKLIHDFIVKWRGTQTNSNVRHCSHQALSQTLHHTKTHLITGIIIISWGKHKKCLQNWSTYRQANGQPCKLVLLSRPGKNLCTCKK